MGNGLYLVLNVVWQVAEEVNTGIVLQSLNGDGVALQICRSIVVLSNPKACSFEGCAFLAQYSHKEVFRYRNVVSIDSCCLMALAAYIFNDVLSLVNGASLANKECVKIISPCAYLIFHRCPNAGVELVVLRLHIGDVEGLIVALNGALAVGRRTDVTMIVTGILVGVDGETVLRGYVLVVGILALRRQRTVVVCIVS